MGRAIGLEIRKVFGVKKSATDEKVSSVAKVSNTIKVESCLPGPSKCEEELEVTPACSSSSRLEIAA